MPAAAQDGRHVALPVTATLDYLPMGAGLAAAGLIAAPRRPEAARLRFRLVSVMRVGPEQLLQHVRVFWGRSDITVLEDAVPPRMSAADR
ncbi:hypothetical protein [Paractinoplanes durhamensis]|uniref:hypothetical protein n=1 Tax=Paractinoplanes durhamensis TaxID=113563 RepID=UPI00363484D0